ncbi:acyltransferase family protein [uncultured Methanobrevibacter sp.]|uniref:acyltransferase family protein n=1 Tax=uncultured Methanobrevibacter sp. TaxID=253161 RepID=UPI0025F52910|nr:acyltransferase family protein [uncultured Methanobrevibacter sp.]
MEVKKRLDKYDNIRGIGILIVLIVHFDILGIFAGFTHKLLVLSCLPLLFFVAGYFSKIGPDEPIKSFKRLIIPYIFFYIVGTLFVWLVLGSKVAVPCFFFKTTMCLWFLMALFIMKIMLPIFNRFKYPILASIICALIMGFINLDPDLLGLTRCFGYFPLFLVGFYYKETKNNITTPFTKIVDFFNKHYKIISVLIIITIIAICYKFDFKFFAFRDPYAGNLLYEMIKRLIVIVVQIGIVMIADKVMTNKNCFLTQFGRNSLSVYLLHVYIFLCLKKIVPHSLKNNLPLSIILIIGLAFLFTYIFSRDVFTKSINKITDGIYNIIAKPI